MKKQNYKQAFYLLVFLFLIVSPTNGQSQISTPTAIDAIIVIDNSCSMFAIEDVPSDTDCGTPAGNDARNQRLSGVQIFLSAMGLGQENEEDYQIGIIEFGDEANVIAPLQPLTLDLRGSLAETIKTPRPIPYTDITEALVLAYETLRNAPNRNPNNLPAVILITDGLPDKSDVGVRGEPDDLFASAPEIARIIKENNDIPLFIMLLQGNEGGRYSADFDEYVGFWREEEADNEHVFVSLIESDLDLADAYNEIMARLQSGKGTSSLLVTPNEPLRIFVSRFVQRIIINVIHDDDPALRGNIVITDPLGNIVAPTDLGVFSTDDLRNQVQSIVIGSERLEREANLKDDVWIIESDRPVRVNLDLRGAYQFEFSAPQVLPVDAGVPNVYLAKDRQSPQQGLLIEFSLRGSSGEIITVPQTISLQVTNPDGSISQVSVDGVEPQNGIYQILYEYRSTYAGSLDNTSRFRFEFEAGGYNIESGPLDSPILSESNPIAGATLLVDVGRGAFIENVSPVSCLPNQPALLQVTLGDYEYSISTTVRVRLSDGSQDVVLASAGNNIFEVNVESWCAPLIENLPCSSDSDANWTVDLVAQALDGSGISSQKSVPVTLIAPTCVPPTVTPTLIPTPTSTPSPTPTPLPTPIPDNDGDGGNDLIDLCPTIAGGQRFNWCPTPWWVWLSSAVGALLLLVFLALFLIPYINVNFVNPPPKAFFSEIRNGKAGPVRGLESLGRSIRKNKITIGGDKAIVKITGLKPFEYVVVQEGMRVAVYTADEKGNPKGSPTIIQDERGREFGTSDNDVKFMVTLPPQKSSFGGSGPINNSSPPKGDRPSRPDKPTRRG